MNFVFWHPCLSIHHAPLLRSLSSMPDTNVTLVARMSLEDGREMTGWSKPDYGRVRLVDTTNTDWRSLVPSIVKRGDSQTLHLASDALSHRISRRAWKFCAEVRVPFGFISICPGMYVGRISRWLRRPFYRHYVRRAAQAANPILAISRECRQFYIENGFSVDRIFPWAYFVDEAPRRSAPESNGELRLVYLGRFIARKRVDLLLHALARALQENRHITLTIVGGGPAEQSLRELSNALCISTHVNFRPTIPHADVQSELQKHDALVLPTELDDWGVVINEALQAGLAVITTENAGASELIHCSQAGVVCRCSEIELAAAIVQLASSPEVLCQMKESAQTYSQTISPNSAAQYLRAIAEHVLHRGVRPRAPWQCEIPCGERA